MQVARKRVIQMVDLLGSGEDLLLLASGGVVVEERGELPKGSRASGGWRIALRSSAVDWGATSLHGVVDDRVVVVGRLADDRVHVVRSLVIEQVGMILVVGMLVNGAELVFDGRIGWLLLSGTRECGIVMSSGKKWGDSNFTLIIFRRLSGFGELTE